VDRAFGLQRLIYMIVYPSSTLAIADEGRETGTVIIRGEITNDRETENGIKMQISSLVEFAMYQNKLNVSHDECTKMYSVSNISFHQHLQSASKTLLVCHLEK